MFPRANCCSPLVLVGTKPKKVSHIYDNFWYDIRLVFINMRPEHIYSIHYRNSVLKEHSGYILSCVKYLKTLVYIEDIAFTYNIHSFCLNFIKSSLKCVCISKCVYICGWRLVCIYCLDSESWKRTSNCRFDLCNSQQS